MLATLTQKAPKASRSDKRAKAAIVDDMVAKGADRETAENIAKGIIDLYPTGAINSVMTNYHSFNAYHGAVTVEYLGGKGAPRLLSIHKQQEHSDRFHTAKLAFEQAKASFVGRYESMVEEMRLKWGQYFDPSDYPAPGAIANHFRMEMQYMPIADPTAFELGQFAEDQRQDLERQMSKAMERAAEKATKQYIARLREQLGHVSDQLRHGKRLHGTLLTNLQDLLGAELNVTAKPELDAVLTGTNDAANSVAAALESKEQIDRDTAAQKIESIDRKLAGIF
jgi:hypothetical protein